MKTIEERAFKKYCTHCGARTEYNCSHVETPCPNVRNYIKIATEQRTIDDERIAELEKEKASLVLEVHNKNKRIAELKALKE